ncbi:MAG: adenosine kinase [Alphaproteobacteria bacterium]|nr:adenosine kinase [Alphaproteobacteria bacterium]
MSDARTDVVAIGNAIVDIIARCDDTFLTRNDIAKGHMHLVDADRIAALYQDVGQAIEISGGSAANTVAGLSSFGGSAAFIGKVANDEFGKIFAHDIRAAAVQFDSKPVAGAAPTSRSLIAVTPDGERTMNTFLGISTDLDDGEIDPDVIGSATITYLEGYLFDQPEAKAAFRQAADIAKKKGRQVALTLSDSFCVDRHRDEFRTLVKDGIDILFANESEITALYQTSSFDDAASQAGQEVSIAAITRGVQGSVIYNDQKPHSIASQPVAQVVDTTGAGDLYAAGVLFGIARGYEPARYGSLGSLAAAEIISHIGARPEASLATLAQKTGLLG